VPTVEQGAARDLVRAREDCCGGLMRTRHRVSKLLLRHGVVYSGGQPWTAHTACSIPPVPLVVVECEGAPDTVPPGLIGRVREQW
jgi:hypothetical protein